MSDTPARPRSASINSTTLCLDEMFRLGAGHVESMVDERGRTYFDVFLTKPAEAAFDWPDFVDLPARYWEAAIMIEEATGQRIASKERSRKWLFSHFEANGLAYRPDGPISVHIPEMFDQSRLLYSLVSAHMHDPRDAEVKARMERLIAGLTERTSFVEDYAYLEEIGLYFGGTLIRPLVQAGLATHNDELIEYGGKIARGLFFHSDLVASDGKFKGHVHGALSAIAGALSYAIVKGDAALKQRAIAGFRYAVSISTSFGFVPELAQKDDDMIACETCALMDYLDVALLLARHVDAGYWDIVEKATRNHLWESQTRDASWLPSRPGASDDGDVIRGNLAERMRGAFAGWSAPHCLLAYEEEHGCDWCRKEERKPIYLGKVRAVQNCCAGGGIRAVFQVWSNIVTKEQGTVNVNLSLDRSTEEVDVASFLPFDGSLVLRIKQDAVFRWRYPNGIDPTSITVAIDGAKSTSWKVEGVFLNLGRQRAGAEIALSFALPARSEKITIGNKGFQQYEFEVDWLGDTVLAVKPNSKNGRSGYSRVMKSTIPSSYGDDGIGPIYQRGAWERAGKPTRYDVASNRACRMDWYSLARPESTL